MAASMGWRQNLNRHELFEVLRKNKDKLALKQQSINLFALNNNDLYVYDTVNCAILCVKLTSLARDPDDFSFQTLLFNAPPTHDVTNLKVSVTGSSLALIGRHGISIVHLPQRWGRKGQFEGGKEKVLCNTLPMAERLFLGDSKLVICQARWHPGSIQDEEIIVLTSDNNLRFFKPYRPEEPEHLVNLADPSFIIDPVQIGPYNTPLLLGETAVDFDVGPPIELVKKNKAKTEMSEKTEHAWPIFILKGCGDVCQVITSLDKNKQLQTHASSPMDVFPNASDNYGSDACSLLCLRCSPPVLVIGTTTGVLYHCVVLARDEAKSDDKNQTSLSKIYKPLPQYLLHVYEQVELELFLTESDATEPEDVSSPAAASIVLHRDNAMLTRYHCTHHAGVHTVVLPWLAKFVRFSEEDDTDILLRASGDDGAVVEHLVCTMPFPTSPPCPVIGIAMTTDRVLGLTLIILTAALDCISLPLRSLIHQPPQPLLSASPSKQSVSPMRKHSKEPFNVHIQHMLTRNISNPVLRTRPDVELSSQESVQLLGRITQVFREQYLQKHDRVREEILRRSQILHRLKEQQMADIRKAKAEQIALKVGAEDLAEKYEETRDKHDALVKRLEEVMKKIESQVSVQSNAEKEMNKELEDMAEPLKVCKNAIKQLKFKQDYQKRQIPSQKTTQSPRSSPGLNRDHMTKIKDVLKKEGEDIGSLIKKINDLKVNVEA